MTSDIAGVESAVWLYLNGLHDGDVEGLARVLAPTSALYASADGAPMALAIQPLARPRPEPQVRPRQRIRGAQPDHSIAVVGDRVPSP